MNLDKEQLKALFELSEKLEKKGVKLGQWGETEEHQSENPLFKDQKEMWEQARTLLQEQVKKDQEKIAELQEMVDRLKHGGGK